MKLLTLILSIVLPLVKLWADPDRQRRTRRARELAKRAKRLAELSEAVASEDGEKMDEAVQKLFDRADAAGL